MALRFITTKVAHIPVVEINLYPNYLYFYIFQLILPNLFGLAVLLKN